MGKSQRNYSHSKPDNFVTILYRILESGKYWCLHWNEDGTEVVIERPETVADEVLPRYFGTKKYQSFTRQFHLYGFRRVTDGRKERTLKGHCRFRHPEFLRNHPHLLDKIARVKVPRHPSAQQDIMSSGMLANDETMRINPYASTQAVTLPPIQLSSENVQDEDDKALPHQQLNELSESPHVFPQTVQMAEKDPSPMEFEAASAPEYQTLQARQAVTALQSLVDVVDELEPTANLSLY
ncbi:winged helix DNA-binding domain-containing protein [Linderina pennispora]|uniref:Winged helix DNA-binding domain-containing protein n=1 Tax=Linderina pennispora TaxID=61395 RepID=A0A1Y1WF24_9FUNG|nr:winged helix DNA-binding domain-containing protein [Linderina pennispora]ORX72072.1 winged helix DNA-binding domain-containing protein [Linderina pennispora]